MILQINEDTFDITESIFNDVEAEYTFLTETLGWKESLGEYKKQVSNSNHIKNVTKLLEYLFLTEQMG